MTKALIKQEEHISLQNAPFEDQTIIENARKILADQKSDTQNFLSVSESLQQILEYCGRTDSRDQAVIEVKAEEDDADHTGSRKWVAASLVVDPLSKTYAL